MVEKAVKPTFVVGDVVFDKIEWRFRQFRGILATDNTRCWVSLPCLYYKDATTVDDRYDVSITNTQFLSRMVPIPNIAMFEYAERDSILEDRRPAWIPIWRVKTKYEHKPADTTTKSIYANP